MTASGWWYGGWTTCAAPEPSGNGDSTPRAQDVAVSDVIVGSSSAADFAGPRCLSPRLGGSRSRHHAGRPAGSRSTCCASAGLLGTGDDGQLARAAPEHAPAGG